MKTVLQQMLEKYKVNSIGDKRNAIQEVVQEAVLCGLSRAGLFKRAAFYGGTALRIFYRLDRFSEDLDFTLTDPDLNFDLSEYFPVLERELASLGLHFEVEMKEKTADTPIRSAFVKGNTKEQIFTFYGEQASVHPDDKIKIKVEVDIDPPPHASSENKFGLRPYPYSVRTYDIPSLFAGKIHAVLCRKWRNRMKGRDLYDYCFFIARGAAVNIPHLKARLIESGYIAPDFDLTVDSLITLLEKRFNEIDYDQAKEDAVSFITDKSALALWSPEFFTDITKQIKQDVRR